MSVQYESTGDAGKGGKVDRKFKRAVGRVLIALSFKPSPAAASRSTSCCSNPAFAGSSDHFKGGSPSCGSGYGLMSSGSAQESHGKMQHQPHQQQQQQFQSTLMRSPSRTTNCSSVSSTVTGIGGGCKEAEDSISSSTSNIGVHIVHSFAPAIDDSDQELTPPRLRRERRKAICESKALDMTCNNHDDDDSLDDVDNSVNNPASDRLRHRQLSFEDLSQGGQKETENCLGYSASKSTKGRRRAVPPPLIKRNTIADFANTKAYQASTASLISACDQEKKTKSTFSLLKLIDKKAHRSKDNLCPMTEVLQSLKPSEFNDHQLGLYKDGHWLKVMSGSEPEISLNISDTERKRREAVWELFTSECVFLFDHLMALKHCFMEPLKKVQVEGHLMFAEPPDLFGNLDELCYVSYTFCHDFIRLLLKDSTVIDFGKTEVLVQGLKRFSELTRDAEVYHDYCLNYPKAMSYLDQLRKNEDFCDFEKWCEQDQRCRRLQLTDLLISPLQHCTKFPLLLNNIRHYTEDVEEQKMLTESLVKLEASLKNLELKMISLKNFERIQEIQQQIVWQSITELEPRAFIPEFLRSTLSRQPCARILSSPRRQLIHEGPVTLLEVSKTIDMYLFLFDDILLLTKIKKAPRKKSSTSETSNPYSAPKPQTDGALFVVHRQPLALDRFTVNDIRPPEASVNGLKNAFVLLQVSRFQQILAVYTLQTFTDTAKAAWLSHLQSSQEKYKENLKRLGTCCRPSSTSYLDSSNDNLASFYENSNFLSSASNSSSSYLCSSMLGSCSSICSPSSKRRLSPSGSCRTCSSNRNSACEVDPAGTGHESRRSAGRWEDTDQEKQNKQQQLQLGQQQQQLLQQRKSTTTIRISSCGSNDADSKSNLGSHYRATPDVAPSATVSTTGCAQHHPTNTDTAPNVVPTSSCPTCTRRRFLSPPSTCDDAKDASSSSSSPASAACTCAGGVTHRDPGSSMGNPRSRPSSLHSKRRSMLKAIREKSLSIDLPSVPLSLNCNIATCSDFGPADD